jgi:hypothetical protein
MNKIFILSAAFIMLCNYHSFAASNCATKYHEFRAKVFNQDITYEQKAQVYERLFDAERLCTEGKTKAEKRALNDAAGLVDLDEVFKGTGEKN